MNVKHHVYLLRDAGGKKRKEGRAEGLHAPWLISTDWHSTPLLLTECSCVVRMSVAKLLQPLEKDVWGEAPHQVHRQAVTLKVTARTEINFLTDQQRHHAPSISCSAVTLKMMAGAVIHFLTDYKDCTMHQVHRQAVTLEVTASTEINFLTDYKDCTTHQAHHAKQ